jgi:hypothetical protein
MKSDSLLVYAAAVAIVMVSSPLVFGLITQSTLNTSGVMADVHLGIYVDSEGTQPMTSVNWGVCYVNVNMPQAIYIRNEGNLATTLGIFTTNWTPLNVADDFLFTADCNGTILQSNEVIAATFSLKPLSGASALESFSFDIVVQGQDNS